MAIIHGKIKSGLEWTDDFQASQDDDGVWSVSISFNCKLSEVSRLSPGVGAPCPASGWAFAKLKTKSVSNEKAGIAKVTCQFAGLTNEYDEEESPELGTSSLSVTTQEEAIMSHKRYKDLSDVEKETILRIAAGDFKLKPGFASTYINVSDHEDGKTYPLESDAAFELAGYLRKGVESYLAAGTIYSISYKADSFPNASLNKVSKIDAPQGAPAVNAGYNWLYIGANINKDGKGIYNVEKQWRLSGPGGWDSVLYS
jgi:hypothetical protein